MNQKKISLGICLMLVGLVSYPSVAGITLRASRIPEAQPIQVTRYLRDENDPLQRALLIHNLMNEIPELHNTAMTAENLKKQGDLFREIQENLTACNVKKLGKVFKDPQKVWAKMVSNYEQKRQAAKVGSQQPLDFSLQHRQQENMNSWKISRDIMIDVYQNPEKWGEVNSNEAFPLWQDQISLYEKEWNQFYEKLNAAYGVPAKGRPDVDEETRHNASKYDAVLAAHKAYVSEISRGRPVNSLVVKANPPKAPKALPQWQEIVRIDPQTGKVVPELPEPWKKMSDNQFKNYAEGGEMSKVFSGKSFTPTSEGSLNVKSDLENEYDISLAVDAMDKGVATSLKTQQEMVNSFETKLVALGLNVNDFDISNRGQTLRMQKQLKDMKKEAMKEAYQYIELLEKQERDNPAFASNRQKLNSRKVNRMSQEARNTMGLSNILETSQMSPVVQQRLVLAALEKDEGASVYLTQTNAMNVDQLIREQKATDKIIAESHRQMDSALEQQRAAMPQIEKCRF